MRKRGLYSRCFAWMMARAGQAHGQLVDEHKRRLLGGLEGTVVELGPGTGPNLAYFSPQVRWIGLEPNPHMHPYLRQEAHRLGLSIELLNAASEAIPLPDASADAVVSTLVLCSVQSLEQTFSEVQRVLKPGGRFVFLEHVAAPRGSRARLSQDLVTPLWRIAGDGCHPNREILAALERAGFARVEVQNFSIAAPIIGPHIAGVAYRGSHDYSAPHAE